MREAVIGRANRRPTPAELDKMRAFVEEGMKAGAFGMSTGLFYVPGAFTPIEEVIELAKVAAKYGGIHISHMRDEAFGVLDSVRETIRIGEEGGLPTQVTHHKIVGPANYGKSVETLKLIDAARVRGVDATSDQYPYTASSNAFTASMIPQWGQEGGREQMLARLKNPATRKEIGAETVRIIREERGGGDPEERLPRALRFRRGDGGKKPGRRRADARHGADDRERRRSGDVDRRAGQLPGRVPRDERAGSRAHHAPSGDDDRVRRVGADSGTRACRIPEATARSRACLACTCASAT